MAVISLIGVVSLWHADGAAPLSAPFEDGTTQLNLEDAFDEALVIKKASLHAWTAARYAAFGEALSGAVVGHDGWLFTKEEYQIDATFDDQLAASLQKIEDVTTQLQAVGSTVIVVLVPDKARVMNDKLLRKRAPLIETRYDTALTALQQANVTVVDPRHALIKAKETAPVFMRTDTHWTPYGANVVAQAAGPLVHAAAPDHKIFETTLAEQSHNKGDLLSFVDTGVFAHRLGLSDETYNVYETLASGGSGLDLFGDVTVHATLIGTSYSAISKWNFLGFLQTASETDILNESQEGLGPFKPMQAYLKKVADGATPHPVVIWEIPERYLTVEATNA